MKWLALATVLVLPAAAVMASRMSHHSPPGPLPRLIESREARGFGPVLGVLLVDRPSQAREE